MGCDAFKQLPTSVKIHSITFKPMKVLLWPVIKPWLYKLRNHTLSKLRKCFTVYDNVFWRTWLPSTVVSKNCVQWNGLEHTRMFYWYNVTLNRYYALETLHCTNLRLWLNEGEGFTSLKDDTAKKRLLAYFETFYHDPLRP